MEEDSARPDAESAEQKARAIWAEARRKVQAGDCDFTGWRFPQDPDGMGFAGLTFRGETRFDKATFEGDAPFDQATFEAEASFSGGTFQGQACFDEGTFEEGAWFDQATFEGHASFEKATFRGIGIFSRAMLERSAWFEGATFEGDAGFDEATLNGDAWFREATFKAYAPFGGTEAKEINLPYPWEKPRPFQRAEAGESAYRLAKESAQRRGDYRRAGHYHYAEQCAINAGHRMRACWPPWRRDFWRVENSPIFAWGEWVVGRNLFGYGERPLRVVLAAVLVILCWTAVYWFGGVVTAVTPEGHQIVARHQLWSSLYFSIVTFTTLGYGDLRPPETLRLVAAAEALLGAALMALFIVCLARKFTR